MLLVVALGLLVAAVIYLSTQCQSLPVVLPGREAGSTHRRIGYAAVAFVFAALTGWGARRAARAARGHDEPRPTRRRLGVASGHDEQGQTERSHRVADEHREPRAGGEQIGVVTDPEHRLAGFARKVLRDVRAPR